MASLLGFIAGRPWMRCPVLIEQELLGLVQTRLQTHLLRSKVLRVRCRAIEAWVPNECASLCLAVFCVGWLETWRYRGRALWQLD